MTATTANPSAPTPAIDEETLMAFVHRAVADVGTVLGGSMIVLGDRLGLYRAMAGAGPLTAAELATRTGTVERYVREWLSAQAATGYISYEGDGRFALSDEHAVVLTDETSPACVIGAFETALASVHSTDRLADAFRTGEGVGWGEHHHDLFEGCERFFRPGYLANLVGTWLPALDGAHAQLTAGARVADVGCGLGASTILMAEAFPASTFTGFDAHEGSIVTARERAAAAGVVDHISFEARPAREIRGPFDLVCFFDCLHDMGDPVGSLAHIRAELSPTGSVMLVEPMAGDTIEENLNPVGAAYYGFSTLLCTPGSLSQDVGAALGAQAGEARLRDVATAAGFSSVRRVAETPFNMVLELKP
ncbi:MAG: class I SAM-dependent methyltransferase [Acidimicrobiia bacterium]|nr:class I SAM-dependent methyltransferase [Acidimicrobiia bacterium]